jgi:hypothetical protein
MLDENNTSKDKGEMENPLKDYWSLLERQAEDQ